jgi:hypothetical protein
MVQTTTRKKEMKKTTVAHEEGTFIENASASASDIIGITTSSCKRMGVRGEG